jgi:hypothetical protein
VTAASSQTPAALGHYVALAGASTQSAAAIGHYVPVTGASSQTPAAAGYYVATAGASTQTAAPLGRYVSTTGQTAALMATAGYYVPVTGASSQTPAAEGYYVATEGASLQTPARYSYFAGATASTAEPLVNDGAAGALLAPLAVAGREIRLLQSLNSQRGIDNNGSATVHVPAGQTLQLGGTFTGAGALIKAGAGDLVLQTRPSGSLSVTAGSAQAPAGVAGSASVSAAGVLQISGTAGALNNQGTVKVGSSGLTVQGSFSASPGSLTELSLTGSGPGLTVQGAASLGGVLKLVNLTSAALQASPRYSLIAFALAPTGRFATIEGNELAGYSLLPVYDNASLSLQVQSVSMTSWAATPDQRSAAAALEQQRASATGDLRDVINNLTTGSVADGVKALAQINPRGAHAQVRALGSDTLELAQQFRIASAVSSIKPPTRLMGLQAAARQGTSAWASAYNRHSELDASTDSPARSIKTAGLSMGAQVELGEAGLSVVGGSVNRVRIETVGQDMRRHDDVNLLTVHAGWRANSHEIDVFAAAGSGKSQQSRHVEVAGLPTRTAQAQGDSTHYGLGARLSARWADPSWQPFVGASALWLRTGAMQESQADALNLSVQAHRSSTQTLELGLKWRSDPAASQWQSWRWTVELAGQFSRVQSDDMVQRLQGSAAPFVAAGYTRSGWGGKAMAGGVWALSKGSSLQFGATLQNTLQQTSQGLAASYARQW